MAFKSRGFKSRRPVRKSYPSKSKYLQRSQAGRIPRPMRTNNSMQSAALQGTRMKFTSVFDINATPGFSANMSFAILGQRVLAPGIASTSYDLGSVNPDGKTQNFFALFQQYCVTGVAVKLIFPEPG